MRNLRESHPFTVLPVTPQETEVMTQRDAAMFPVYASGALFGMYCLFKVFGKEYVNLLVGGYFFLVGSIGATRACRPVGEALLPASLTENPYQLVFSQQGGKNRTEEDSDKESAEKNEAADVKPTENEGLIFDMTFDYIDLVCLAVSAAVGIVYVFTKVCIQLSTIASNHAADCFFDCRIGSRAISLDSPLRSMRSSS